MQLTGHMMAEGSLNSQTGSTGEAMRSYIHYDLPGIDILNDALEFTTAKQGAECRPATRCAWNYE